MKHHFTPTNVLTGCAILATAIFMPPQVQADEPPVLDQLEPPALIELLGDDAYAVRNAASAELRARGAEAEPFVLKALTRTGAANTEIRARCRRIIGWIAFDRREAKIAEFIAGVEGEYDLPGWKTLQTAAGDSPKSRQFYSELYREFESELQALNEKNPDVFRAQAAEMVKLLTEGKRRGEPTSTPLLVIALLSGCDAKVFENSSASMRTGIQLYSYLGRSDVKQEILKGEQSAMLKGLLSLWMDCNIERSLGGYTIKLAMDYGFRDKCLNASRKLLKKKTKNSSSTTPYAMLCLARFGGEEDIAVLKPYLEKTQTCHTWSNQGIAKKLIKTQTRDVALAVSIHLSGDDPASFGFKYLRRSEETVFAIYCMGFTEDADREAAHAKWGRRAEFEEPPSP